MKTPIEMMFDEVEWVAFEGETPDSPEGLPIATHSGVLKIAEGIELKCYRLNDGRAIFDAQDVIKFFGLEGI